MESHKDTVMDRIDDMVRFLRILLELALDNKDTR
jgi:hypothetical protein